MESSLSPAKVVLLAVHFASHADITSLTQLAAEYATILRQDLLLRILLTYLPETVKSIAYVDFLECLSHSEFKAIAGNTIDLSPLQDLSEEQASKKARKLHLLQLAKPDLVPDGQENPLVSFLFERAYKVDEEAGMLTQLPDLLLPFLDYSPAIRTWMASTILPLLRREIEYYPQDAATHTIRSFQKLPDRAAVEYLLGQTGQSDEDYPLIGRDLDGLIGPWLHNNLRWKERKEETLDREPEDDTRTPHSPGWEQVLEWLILQASRAWKVVVGTVEQWDGPAEVTLAPDIELHHTQARQRYLHESYIRAALASAYLIPEPTIEALSGAYKILKKVMILMNHEPAPSLQAAAANLPNLADSIGAITLGTKLTGHMRNDLLNASNCLTNPDSSSANLLIAIILSAYISTSLGVPCSVRSAGDLAFLKDSREQKAEFSKLIRTIAIRAPRNDDEYWLKARRELLWLHSWGRTSDSESARTGFLGAVTHAYIETEFLKALLSNSRKFHR
jgi:hypothetical protein